jgi:hypothetical protein
MVFGSVLRPSRPPVNSHSTRGLDIEINPRENPTRLVLQKRCDVEQRAIGAGREFQGA